MRTLIELIVVAGLLWTISAACAVSKSYAAGQSCNWNSDCGWGEYCYKPSALNPGMCMPR